MVREGVQKALISMHKMLQSSIVAHVHLLHPVRARDLTSYSAGLAQKLVNLLVISLTRHAKARSRIQNLLPL